MITITVFASALCTVAFALSYPVAPPTYAFEAGKEFADQHADVKKLNGPYTKTLGTWFDGKEKLGTDYAVWVTPELVATELGYREALGEIKKSEVADRWSSARALLAGRTYIVVHLASFPKADPLELADDDAEADPEGAEAQSFTLTFGAGRGARPERRITCFQSLLASSVEKREWHDIVDRPFYDLTPLAPLFIASTDSPEADDGVPLGGFYENIYLVSFPKVQIYPEMKSMTLTVVRKKKIQSASFPLTKQV